MSVYVNVILCDIFLNCSIHGSGWETKVSYLIINYRTVVHDMRLRMDVDWPECLNKSDFRVLASSARH